MYSTSGFGNTFLSGGSSTWRLPDSRWLPVSWLSPSHYFLYPGVYCTPVSYTHLDVYKRQINRSRVHQRLLIELQNILCENTYNYLTALFLITNS